jgi:CheY-like chemotaxis protein
MEKFELKKEFGTAVKAERNRLGLSQETLAERANLHRTYITDIERGARNLSLESICKLAAALEMPVQTLFSQAQGVAKSSTFPAGTPGQLVDVMLVEDNPQDIELTMRAFKLSGLSNRVFVVRDGMSALDYIFCKRQFAQRRPETNPQLVLLDLGLPKMHGLEVLRRIRAEERTRDLTVVVLTSSRQDADLKEAIALGAKAYIVKPVSFHSLSEITPKLSFQWALLGDNRMGRLPMASQTQV